MYFQSDRRFLQLDEKDRERYFEDYIEDLKLREIKRKQEHSKRKIESLKRLFESQNISAYTKYEDVLKQLHSNTIFKSTDKLDQLKAFLEYKTEKLNEEKELKQKSKIRTERKNRENFRGILDRLASEQTLLYNSKWSEIAFLVKDEQCYKDLLLQPGTKPIDIFKDVQDILRDKFNVHKVAFKSLLKTKSIKLGTDISKEDFNKNLNEHIEYSPLPPDIKDLLYDYYIFKVNQKKSGSSKPEKSREESSSRHKRKRSESKSSSYHKSHKKHKKKHKRSRSRDKDRERDKKDVEEGELGDLKKRKSKDKRKSQDSNR